MFLINIEVILKSIDHNSKNSLKPVLLTYLEKCKPQPNSVIKDFNKDEHPILYEQVYSIIIDDIPDFDNNFINFENSKIKWFFYTLNTHGPQCHSEEDDENGEINIATHLTLPSADLFNAWENLYYDNNIKENLLKYAQTIMEFSDKGVDCNIVSCNRVILLHGPPGTGKTSLCKAVAQKLSIRMQDRYSSGLFIEINSHSLFSKWFSESGKLVTKMFTKIKEIVENSDILVCVLIDEVESLAHARNQCVSGTEPSDSIRVVNAVLTQIDQIKRHSNVLIFATSNMTEAIDLAFIDRADIKQFLGLPSVSAIYKIYYSCIIELMKTQVIATHPIDTIDDMIRSKSSSDDIKESSKFLFKICEQSVGLSGRCLRKIPFIAHSLFINGTLPNISDFLKAMTKAVEREHLERTYFSSLKSVKEEL